MDEDQDLVRRHLLQTVEVGGSSCLPIPKVLVDSLMCWRRGVLDLLMMQDKSWKLVGQGSARSAGLADVSKSKKYANRPRRTGQVGCANKSALGSAPLTLKPHKQCLPWSKAKAKV